jgi:heme/copper-type cytochrome/quinol oxidase subunit 2
MKRFVIAVLVAGATCLLATAPASAQQIVDAGKEGDGSGGLAFVLFAILVFVIGFSLFYMDRVRRRRSDSERVDN